MSTAHWRLTFVLFMATAVGGCADRSGGQPAKVVLDDDDLASPDAENNASPPALELEACAYPDEDNPLVVVLRPGEAHVSTLTGMPAMATSGAGRDLWSNLAVLLEGHARREPTREDVWIAIDSSASGFADDQQIAGASTRAVDTARAAGYATAHTCRFVPDPRFRAPFPGGSGEVL